MSCKKIFIRAFMALFIVSIVLINGEVSGKSLPPAAKIQEGINRFNALDYKGALGLLDEIIALNLSTAAEYNLRGEYFVKLGEYRYDTMKYDEGKELFNLAIRDYNSAIELAPKDVKSYVNRGNFYCKHGEQDLAVKDYDKVLELDPNNVDAYIGRGNAYTNTGHLAQRDFNRAIELAPNNFKAYMARSIIYLNIGQNNLALEDANKAVALNPENPEVYNNRGLIYNNLKQYDSALKDYSKALELDPKNFSAYKGRGSVYFALQQYELAIEELNKAIEIYPELNAVNLRRHCDYLRRQQ